MPHVVVIGGGWAGCSAALTAARAGARVTVLEKTDQLLGTGLVGGIMRNNGRYTAAEEMIAMGAGELFQATDEYATHHNKAFPGHAHATFYNVTLIEGAVRRLLGEAGVEVRFKSRVTGATVEKDLLRAVTVKGGGAVAGDVFVEATGTAGPMGNCTKYGAGCVMCVLRCPTFGGRVSLAALCGVKEMIAGTSAGTLGAYSGSCKLQKDSLDRALVAELEEKGVVLVPLPEHLKVTSKLALKACQQYADLEYAENLVLLDTGHAKLMSSYFPLADLQTVPGFAHARYADPYSGGVGNSVRYLAISPHDVHLRVEGVENLFCGGEKAGPLVGHTEAICTGALAGHNAVRHALGLAPLSLPTALAVGDAIAHVTEQIKTDDGLFRKYTFSGSVYFKRMQELGLYTTDHAAIAARVEAAGMTGVFARPLTAEAAQVG